MSRHQVMMDEGDKVEAVLPSGERVWVFCDRVSLVTDPRSEGTLLWSAGQDKGPLEVGDVLRGATTGREWSSQAYGAKEVVALGETWAVCKETGSGRMLLYTGRLRELEKLR